MQDNAHLVKETNKQTKKPATAPVQIAEPLRLELIDTAVLNNVAPGPVQYRGSVPIPIGKEEQGLMVGKIITYYTVLYRMEP